MSGHISSVSAALALFLAATASASSSASDQGALRAQRTSDSIHLDGRLNEAAWASAPVFSRFVESFPNAGAPASFRTEVRVLYDDETLYFGVTCFDPEPQQILRQLGRRDSLPPADRVDVSLDSGNDGHTAYTFSVNAAGVLRDQMQFADVNSTASWDAVWDAAVDVNAEGWTTEIAIPFEQLRFNGGGDQTWGAVVRRSVPRTHQIFDSALIPREANPTNTGGLVVSRYGRLEGLQGLKARHGLELAPYVAARATARPQYSDPTRPHPRLVDPGLDLGADFKLALGEGLTLTGAVNPDFGQVEADQVIQNLSNQESYFPEKRPFFLEGLDIFQPVGSEYGSPQQLFYSRRIGAGAPILAAAKVTGAAREGLDVGVLDAVVMGAGNQSLVPVGYTNPGPSGLEPYEANPDRTWRFHLRQPFHFGPESALPNAHPVTTNYFAGVARQRVGSASRVGATFTAATPLEERCQRSEFPTAAEFDAAGCHSGGSNALALDLNVPGEYGGYAQIEASQAVGGPPEGRTLWDGTVLKNGDLGFGGHMRAGKLGGEPWRWDVQYVYEDAKLDLNGVGYQPLSNYQWADLNLHYVRPNGLGALHYFSIDYNLDLNWSTDGRWLGRGVNQSLKAQVQLPNFYTLGVQFGEEYLQYDTREIAGSGIPFERGGDVLAALFFATDPSARLQAQGDVFSFRTVNPGSYAPSQTGFGWDLSLAWRPHDRLETTVDAAYGHKPQGPRFVDLLDDDVAVFGLQDPQFLSVTLRQQFVFTPRLTAQLYAQFFSAAVRYPSQFYGASLDGRDKLDQDALEPVDYTADLSSHFSVANLNAVLRWEYQPGSTLFFVYTRSQSQLPTDGKAPYTIAPARLFDGPANDTVLVKWTYWFQA